MHGDTLLLAYREMDNDPTPARKRRILNAIEITKTPVIRVSGRQWVVPSQSSEDSYIVTCHRGGNGSWEWDCTCPDANGIEATAPADGICKHIYAVHFLGEGRKRAMARQERMSNIEAEEQELLKQMGKLYERTGEHRQEWRLLVNALLDLNMETRNAWKETIDQLDAEPFEFVQFQVQEEEAA